MTLRIVPQVIRERKRDRKKGMVWARRDQTITIEMVLIEIMVAVVIKMKCKGTAESEDRSSASIAKDEDILVENVLLL